MVNEICSRLCAGTGCLQGPLTVSPCMCCWMQNCLKHFGNTLECCLQVGRLQKSMCPLILILRWVVLTILRFNLILWLWVTKRVGSFLFFPVSLKHTPYVLHQVVWQSTYSPDTGTTVKVDDVSWKTGACRPPGSCDFESGQCNFLNVRREDGHDWVLANGGFQGPETDHTTQTPDGRCTFTSAEKHEHTHKKQIPHLFCSMKNRFYSA